MTNSDITNGYINPTVIGLLGQPLPALSVGVLQWNGSAWVFGAGGGGSVTGSGSEYQLAIWTTPTNLAGLTNGAAGTILQSNGTGANPSWVTALANGTTAATQSANDNSTKVATDAFVQAAISTASNFTIANGTNTYTNNTSFPLITSYIAGLSINALFTNSNTGASTMNINSLGAIPLKKNGGSSALQNGDIIAGGIYNIIFDGTNFQIIINTSL